jgi:hypothetical protein
MTRTGKRPARFVCSRQCDRRHAMFRQLLTALRQARETAEAMLALPRPDDDEFMTAAGVAFDLSGFVWCSQVVEAAVESSCLPCCFSDQEADERAG